MPDAVVSTRLGRVAGVRFAGVDAFLGLPYAVPPIGDRRFAPSTLWTEAWTGVRDARDYGHTCHQTTGDWDQDPSEHPKPTDGTPFPPPPSEDCLNLNVFRPSPPTPSPPGAASPPLLPVMVYIHGGGFCSGAGSLAWLNGSTIARRGVVLATLNYRLGPLGFLAHADIAEENRRRGGGGDGDGGLNGVRDQITALRWVREHIRAFGGDPQRVTVFGESSGGVSVCVLNASPLARGLFRRAVIQSGPCIVPDQGWGPASQKAGRALGEALLARLNASSVDELRALPPQALQWDNDTLWSDDFSGYSYDGGVLSREPAHVYAADATTALDLIVGTTSKDGTASFYGAPTPEANATAAQWASAMRTRWGGRSAQVMARYPLARFRSRYPVPLPTASYIEADADERVLCPSRRLAALVAASPRRRVYSFEFAHLDVECDAGWENKVLPWWLNRSALRGSGWSSHGSDVRYVFGTSRGPDGGADDVNVAKTCPFDEAERSLSRWMTELWTSFAADGVPRARDAGRVAWEAFTPHAPATLRLATADAGGSAMGEGKRGDCSFWERHGRQLYI